MSLMGPKEDKAAVSESYPSVGLITDLQNYFFPTYQQTCCPVKRSNKCRKSHTKDLKEHGLDLTEKQLFSYIGATVVKPKRFSTVVLGISKVEGLGRLQFVCLEFGVAPIRRNTVFSGGIHTSLSITQNNLSINTKGPKGLS